MNSEANTMVESDLGTMVINEDSDEDDGTMKSKNFITYQPQHEKKYLILCAQ